MLSRLADLKTVRPLNPRLDRLDCSLLDDISGLSFSRLPGLVSLRLSFEIWLISLERGLPRRDEVYPADQQDCRRDLIYPDEVGVAGVGEVEKNETPGVLL